MALAVVLVAAVAATLGLQVVVLSAWCRRLASWSSRRFGASRAGRWLEVPRNRWLVGAFVVGLVVRVVWVTLATVQPGPGSDAGVYLRTAEDLADGILPRFGGRPSAFFAPGYPVVLVPLVWFSQLTGVSSTLFLASLLNAVAGATTVLSTAYVASAWIGPRTRNVAAWLMALAPAQVYWTSTQHAESVHTALVLAAFVAITVVVRSSPDGTERSRRLALVGLLVGFVMLVRTPGGVLFVVVVLVVHLTDGGWRTAARALGWTALGALVLLVPVAVRNGVQVGVWSPLNTSNATAICLGNHPDAEASFDVSQLTTDFAEDCYRGSPYDDPSAVGSVPAGVDFELRGVDEATWYRDSTRRGLGFIVEDPGEAIRRAGEKLAIAYRDESDAVPGAASFTDDAWAGDARAPLDLVANLWLWSVLALAAVGLVVVPACRRASPVWIVPLLVTTLILTGTSFPHYRHLAVPFLVVLASGGAVALVERIRGIVPVLPVADPPKVQG